MAESNSVYVVNFDEMKVSSLKHDGLTKTQVEYFSDYNAALSALLVKLDEEIEKHKNSAKELKKKYKDLTSEIDVAERVEKLRTLTNKQCEKAAKLALPHINWKISFKNYKINGFEVVSQDGGELLQVTHNGKDIYVEYFEKDATHNDFVRKAISAIGIQRLMNYIHTL